MADKETFYGEVLWFDPSKGYGFIAWSDNSGVKQKDMFVHFSDINCDGFKTLYAENKVSFQIGANKNGSPKAADVKIMK